MLKSMRRVSYRLLTIGKLRLGPTCTSVQMAAILEIQLFGVNIIAVFHAIATGMKNEPLIEHQMAVLLQAVRENVSSGPFPSKDALSLSLILQGFPL